MPIIFQSVVSSCESDKSTTRIVDGVRIYINHRYSAQNLDRSDLANISGT